MEFGDDIVHFSMLDAIRHPPEEHSLLFIEVIDEVVLDIGSESDDAETDVHIGVDVDSIGGVVDSYLAESSVRVSFLWRTALVSLSLI